MVTAADLSAGMTSSLEHPAAAVSDDGHERLGEAGFHAIVEHTSDVIIIVDAAGVIIDSTPSLAQNLGCTQGEVIGRSMSHFLQREDAIRAGQLFAQCGVGPAQTYPIVDWQLRHYDGTVVTYEVAADDLLADPRVAAIVLTMRDVSQPRALQEQLDHLALHDGLTGLPNRASFHDHLRQALADNAGIVVLVLDLDDFKVVNESLGHDAGDQLLRQVADRLRVAVGDDATAARLGGDEFAILVEQTEGIDRADDWARRLSAVLDVPFVLGAHTRDVSASIGVVAVAEHDDDIDTSEVLRCAGIAVNSAKERGTAETVRYRDELGTRMLDRVTRRNDLDRALKANEFFLQFQPVVELASGVIVGCEALVRWRHPTRGLITPDDFIELAEQTGLIVELGRWVLDRSCAQMKQWLDAGHVDINVAVNVSADQLATREFVDDVRDTLIRHELPPDRLVLELTESVLAGDEYAVDQHIRALRATGVKIAMDDFGTGYSSLAYLQKFRFDILKIDKCFVDGLGGTSKRATALVTAIVGLAQSLNLDVVAEGVERQSQHDELWSIGSTFAQGYLFSRPVDADQMLGLLDSPPIGTGRPGGVQDPGRARPAPTDKTISRLGG